MQGFLTLYIYRGEILEEKRVLVIPLKDKSTTSSALARIARGEADTTENVDQDITDETPMANETLEQRAEREILEDLKKKTAKLNSNSNLVVPVADNIKLTGEKEVCIPAIYFLINVLFENLSTINPILHFF